MALDKKDIDLIEKIVYRCGDDIAISIGRSFEHLEERIDLIESRIYERLATIDDRIDNIIRSNDDMFESLREDVRLLGRSE